MKRWPTKPLSDAYWFQEGPGVRKWQFRTSGIKLLNVANITKDGTLDLSKTDRCLGEEEVADKYTHFLADAGDLVIASSGISFDDDGLLRTRGAFVEAHHLPLCLNTSTIRFKSKEGISSLALLRYWLESQEFRGQITRLVTGSAQQNFGPSHLKAITISLPPLAEQERIVNVLDEANELRKLRAQADRRTSDLIPALFHEMFGENEGKIRDRLRLEQIAEIASGVAKGRKFNGRQPVEVPYLRVANVQAGHLDLSEIKTIQALPEEVEELALRQGDVLLTEGGDFDKLGRGAMLEQDLPNCIHQNHVFRVRVQQSKLDPVYFSKFLLTAEAREYFLSCAKRTTNLASINMTQLRSLPVLVPPILLQKQFAARVAEVRAMETEQAASRRGVEALFQSLLTRTFRDELEN